MINVMALILSQSVNIHLNHLRIVIRNVADHITLNITEVINNDRSTVSNFTLVESQSLSSGIVSKLALSNSGILSQTLCDSTVSILNNNLTDFVTSSADSLIVGSGSITSNSQIIRNLNRSRSSVFALSTDINFNQTQGNHTVSTRNSNGLVTLELTDCTTTLTSQSSVLLSIGNSRILQFIQSKTMHTAINAETHDCFQAGNGEIVHNNVTHSSILLF